MADESAGASGGGITREQLLLYVKKQKESIKKLTDDNASLIAQNKGENGGVLLPALTVTALLTCWG